jgi:hypothetical protein
LGGRDAPALAGLDGRRKTESAALSLSQVIRDGAGRPDRGNSARERLPLRDTSSRRDGDFNAP